MKYLPCQITDCKKKTKHKYRHAHKSDLVTRSTKQQESRNRFNLKQHCAEWFNNHKWKVGSEGKERITLRLAYLASGGI